MSKADELLRRALGIFHQALGPMEQLPESYNPVKAWCAEARIYLNAAKDPELDAALAAAGITKRDVLLSLDTRNARQFAQSLIDTYDARSELFTNDAALAANLADRARAYLNEKPHEPINAVGSDKDCPPAAPGFHWVNDGTGSHLVADSASPPHAAAEHAMEPCPHYKWTAKKNCPECAADEREKAIIQGGVDFVMNGPGADIVTRRVPDAAVEPEKPVAWMYESDHSCAGPFIERRVRFTLDRYAAVPAKHIETPLYASPSAQPIAREDGWKRDAERYRLYQKLIYVDQDDSFDAYDPDQMDAELDKRLAALKSAGKEST